MILVVTKANHSTLQLSKSTPQPLMLKKLKLTVTVKKTFSSLGKGMATHSSILAWRIPWTKDYGRVQSMGSQRVGHDWSSLAWRPTISSRTNNNNKKDALFIIGDWNAEVGSQEIPGVTGKFGLGVQNEAGQGLTEFCQENVLVINKHPLPKTQDATHGHHQMVNTEIRLIIFLTAKDSQQEQDL